MTTHEDHKKADHDDKKTEAQATPTKVTPTPTQAELDAVRRGEKVTLAPDGSPVERRMPAPVGEGYTPPQVQVHETPTPTQAELDAVVSGQRLPPAKKEVDEEKKDKAAEAEHERAGYKTRASHPAAHHASAPSRRKEED